MDDAITPVGTQSSRTSDTGNPATRTHSDHSLLPNPHRKGSQSSDKSKHKGKPGAKDGKAQWLHKMTDWLAVSEPSTRALEHHRQDVFRRAGISRLDPDAGAKLQVPVGGIPADAVRPSGPGPEPEEVARRRAEERRRAGKSPESVGGSVFGGHLSQSSSRRSGKSRVENPISPWE